MPGHLGAQPISAEMTVDKAKATAKDQDGVLELTLPKKAPTTSQRLEIS